MKFDFLNFFIFFILSPKNVTTLYIIMTELASCDFVKFYYMQTRIIMAKSVHHLDWLVFGVFAPS